MTTYEEVMRMPKGTRPALSRTILLEPADEVSEDDEDLVPLTERERVASVDDDTATARQESEACSDDMEDDLPAHQTPDYVTVRARDKRTGSVREYAVLKGTPVSEVVSQYARDSGRAPNPLKVRMRSVLTYESSSGGDKIPEPIESVDDCASACSYYNVMCGVHLDS